MSPSAGTRPDAAQLVDLDELLAAYRRPPEGPVSFGTSGHRGTSLKGTFTEAHVLAISEAIARHRRREGIDGPLFVARDTHALSEPAFTTAVEVFVAHGIEVRVDAARGYTPTPALSHAILTHNAGGGETADGIVLTPSHNPPEDGGYKYNPPSGGPADTSITKAIEEEANRLIEGGLADVLRAPDPDSQVFPHDYVAAYVDDLPNVIDIDAIRAAGVHIGADPLGGASVAYFQAIKERLGLNVDVVNEEVDPTFAFMPLDHDGKIRMDCSSPHAMAGLIDLKDRFDVAVACDPDADRHGIVTPSVGLMNPNHYLAVAIHYLFGGARDWPSTTGIGKTLVSSTMIDLVAGLARPPAGRGARRLQMVRGGSDGRLARLRRRGERGRVVPAPRRHAVVDRQGRHPAGAAGGRDHGHDRTRPGRRLRRADRALRRARVPAVDSPSTPERKEKLLKLEPDDITATSWPARRSRRCSRARPATTPRSAA